MEELQNPISRRRMLKRVGAGAAIAWSAPILSSLRTPAFARAYPPRCEDESFVCLVSIVLCAETCACIRSVEGDIQCGADFTCGTVPRCTTSEDCPAGSFCQAEGTGCCGPGVCVPPCVPGADKLEGNTNLRL